MTPQEYMDLLKRIVASISDDQMNRMEWDWAWYDLAFFSTWAWQNIAGQLPNAPMHDEWYGMLDPKPKRFPKKEAEALYRRQKREDSE